MSNPFFDPSKFSLGGITRPILVLIGLLCSGGYQTISKDRTIGIFMFVFAGILLVFWGIVYVYLLLKDPYKLRSEKHEQRMKEIEKLNSLNNIPD